jgi:uncharacterized protein (DUF1330 family)
MGADPEHVLVFALEIRDEALYARYRERMSPILRRYGGAFGYDLAIARVLRSKTEAPIDRVFTIGFPDPGAAEAFFADASYRAIRAELFDPAVGAITRMGVLHE